MATVYRAEDTAGGSPAAVKVLREDLEGDGGAVARFRDEARLLARLGHPRVPRLRAGGRDRTRLFFAMDLLPGETLRRRVSREGPIGWPALGRLAAELADILASVHAVGVFHRDVKPDNVLLAPDGGAALVDFGLSRERGAARLTAPGRVAGTTGYIPPERLAGALEDDPRGDLFGLGMTLAYAATGRDPGVGKESTVLEFLFAAVAAPPDLSRIPGVPPEFARLVARLADPDPARRPASAAEVAREVGSLIRDTRGG